MKVPDVVLGMPCRDIESGYYEVVEGVVGERGIETERGFVEWGKVMEFALGREVVVEGRWGLERIIAMQEWGRDVVVRLVVERYAQVDGYRIDYHADCIRIQRGKRVGYILTGERWGCRGKADLCEAREWLGVWFRHVGDLAFKVWHRSLTVGERAKWVRCVERGVPWGVWVFYPGRVEAKVLGRIDTAVEVDIRSAYASVMRDLPMPTLVVERRDERAPYWVVVADVEVPEGEYGLVPVRAGSRVYYPTGRIHRAVLGKGDVLALLEGGGRILKVYRWWSGYGSVPVYRKAVDYLWQKRAETQRFSDLCKLALVALWGKSIAVWWDSERGCWVSGPMYCPLVGAETTAGVRRVVRTEGAYGVYTDCILGDLGRVRVPLGEGLGMWRKKGEGGPCYIISDTVKATPWGGELWWVVREQGDGKGVVVRKVVRAGLAHWLWGKVSRRMVGREMEIESVIPVGSVVRKAEERWVRNAILLERQIATRPFTFREIAHQREAERGTEDTEGTEADRGEGGVWDTVGVDLADDRGEGGTA